MPARLTTLIRACSPGARSRSTVFQNSVLCPRNRCGPAGTSRDTSSPYISVASDSPSSETTTWRSLTSAASLRVMVILAGATVTGLFRRHHAVRVRGAGVEVAQRGQFLDGGRGCLRDVPRDPDRPAGILSNAVRGDAGVQRRDFELPGRRVRPHRAQIGDDQRWPVGREAQGAPLAAGRTVSERGQEIELVDERLPPMTHHDVPQLAAGSDL